MLFDNKQYSKSINLGKWVSGKGKNVDIEYLDDCKVIIFVGCQHYNNVIICNIAIIVSRLFPYTFVIYFFLRKLSIKNIILLSRYVMSQVQYKSHKSTQDLIAAICYSVHLWIFPEMDFKIVLEIKNKQDQNTNRQYSIKNNGYGLNNGLTITTALLENGP